MILCSIFAFPQVLLADGASYPSDAAGLLDPRLGAWQGPPGGGYDTIAIGMTQCAYY